MKVYKTVTLAARPERQESVLDYTVCDLCDEKGLYVSGWNSNSLDFCDDCHKSKLPEMIKEYKQKQIIPPVT